MEVTETVRCWYMERQDRTGDLEQNSPKTEASASGDFMLVNGRFSDQWDKDILRLLALGHG